MAHRAEFVTYTQCPSRQPDALTFGSQHQIEVGVPNSDFWQMMSDLGTPSQERPLREDVKFYSQELCVGSRILRDAYPAYSRSVLSVRFRNTLASYAESGAEKGCRYMRSLDISGHHCRPYLFPGGRRAERVIYDTFLWSIHTSIKPGSHPNVFRPHLDNGSPRISCGYDALG